MDSLHDILSLKDFDEPPESRAIKAYISDNFQEQAEVIVREKDIVVSVANASLANTLRLRVRQLRAAAKTQKRLVFRIG
jgi:hypothetical protein